MKWVQLRDYATENTIVIWDKIYYEFEKIIDRPRRGHTWKLEKKLRRNLSGLVTSNRQYAPWP